MQQIYLARHGQSTYLKRGLANGDPSLDVPLTVLGRAQAARLGVALAGVPLHLGVTSLFPRTKETARIALTGHDVPLIEDRDLDDVRYGVFEGTPLRQFREWERSHPMDAAPEGGESRRHVVERCAAALEMLLGRSEDTILVVSHDMVVGYMRNAAAGIPPTPHLRHCKPATSYLISRAQAERARQTLRVWLAATA